MLAPLTGVLFIIVIIVGAVIAGEPPDAGDPVEEIIDHYQDNKSSIQVVSFLAALAGLLLIVFGAHLRRVLRAAEGPGGMLSVLPLVAATLIAIGIAIDATISLALAEAVDDIEPSSVQALQALWDNDFIPIAMGMLLLLLSLGISILRYGALPKWIGWVAIVLTIVGFTPAGFAAFIGGAILILVISVILTLRARRGTPAAA
jgi:hypothetical protein